MALSPRSKYRFLADRLKEPSPAAIGPRKQMLVSGSDAASRAIRDAKKRAIKGQNVKSNAVQFRRDVMRTTAKMGEMEVAEISREVVQTA
jgi:hypothetical protein